MVNKILKSIKYSSLVFLTSSLAWQHVLLTPSQQLQINDLVIGNRKTED